MKGEEKKLGYFDSVWYASIQAKMAWVCLTSGIALSCICLFWIDPKGEISTSAISIVSELLVLAGAMTGVIVNFDYKQRQFANHVAEQLAKKQDKSEE